MAERNSGRLRTKTPEWLWHLARADGYCGPRHLFELGYGRGHSRRGDDARPLGNGGFRGRALLRPRSELGSDEGEQAAPSRRDRLLGVSAPLCGRDTRSSAVFVSLGHRWSRSQSPFRTPR